jgi:hypothetical protein
VVASRLKDFHVKPTPCPYCESINDGALAVDGDQPPKPGDIAFCAYCHRPSVYTKRLDLRRPNIKDKEEIRKWLKRRRR